MLYLDIHTRRKAVWIGAILAPMVAVQVVRVFDGAGPASAPAAQPSDSTSLTTGPNGGEAPAGADATPPASKPLTEAQKHAAAFVAGYRVPPSLRSPMDGPDPVTPVVEPARPASTPEPVAPPPEPRVDPLAGLALSAIVGSDHAAVAIISHKLRRVGDEVAPGWRVGEIDTRHRHVVLTGPDGQTTTLAPPSPGE